VGIFRRGTKDSSAELKPNGASSDGQDSHDSDEAAGANGATSTARPSRPSRSGGPFDRSEVEGLEGRLDLGALWLTGAPGMELRLEVEEESQNVVGVTAVLGESSVQLQAFAAPRSEGIWDDIRAEIAASITGQGGTADKMSGPLGNELRAQMPGQDPNGRTVFSPVRFVGVDGPRWFLRAVLSGPAAHDDDAAATLLEVVRATVVVRGDEAMAPRELLALQLPEQPDPATEVPVDGDAATPGAPSIDDFKPFERGPEITEIH
jgi:Protein of unknown function (DUF3710)